MTLKQVRKSKRRSKYFERKYGNREPIGSYCICNFGSLVFFLPDSDDGKGLIVATNNGQKYTHFKKCHIYTEDSHSFIRHFKSRVYLDEVMRTTV